MVRQGPAKPRSPVRIWVPPLLYLVATPIGNLKDITLRAIEVLKECDLIYCEDTRKTGVLLKSIDVSCPTRSFHKFSEARKEDEVIAQLKEGKTIALVSDAGTPCIQDPGHRLILRCQKEELTVSALPGPSAVIMALSLSGLSTEKFQFIGYFPKKSGRLERSLRESLVYDGTTIAFESPHRVVKMLKVFVTLSQDVQIVIARELTKKFEEVLRGTPVELLTHFEARPPKGEFVVLIPGSSSVSA